MYTGLKTLDQVIATWQPFARSISVSVSDQMLAALQPFAGLTKSISVSECHQVLAALQPFAGLTKSISVSECHQVLAALQPLAGLTKSISVSACHQVLAALQPLAGLTKSISVSACHQVLAALQPLAGLTKSISVSECHQVLAATSDSRCSTSTAPPTTPPPPLWSVVSNSRQRTVRPAACIAGKALAPPALVSAQSTAPVVGTYPRPAVRTMKRYRTAAGPAWGALANRWDASVSCALCMWSETFNKVRAAFRGLG